MTAYEEIIYDAADPVAMITLNRPQALNAWTPQMSGELHDALRRATLDPAVVGIVITGAARAFCAGADLRMLAAKESPPASTKPPGTRNSRDSKRDDFSGQFTALLAVPKPVVAAINGPIAGMAVALALACDLRFMANDALLTTSFSQRGLIAEWGLSWLLPRLVGPAVALDLLYSSRKIDGREAARLGLVNAALPTDEVVEHSRQYVIGLAERCSPTALSIMKRQVYEQLHAGLGDAERDAGRLMRESFERPDFREGVSSFLEKRPPLFDRLSAE